MKNSKSSVKNLFFLECRRDAAIAARLPPSWGTQDDDLIPQKSIGFVCHNVRIIFPNITGIQHQFDNFVVVRKLINNIVSKVCRLSSERQRQANRRKHDLSADRRSDSRRTSQRNWFIEKYRSNESFRKENIAKVSDVVFKKYHNQQECRDIFRQRMLRRYHSNDAIRTKTIQKALERYQRQCSSIERERRRKYDQSRRILKKYIALQTSSCATKCNDWYKKHLDSFRKLSKEGPDYVCVICRLTLFRNQVLPFVEEKYVKKEMISQVNNFSTSYPSNIQGGKS